MSIQFPRGDAAANNAHTGLSGSISVDFQNQTLRVHDGETAGGAFQVGMGQGPTPIDLSISSNNISVTVVNSGGSNATIPSATGSGAGVMSASQATKLNGIAAEATKNATDAQLRARGSHTGTQLSSTISDFESRTKQIIESGDFSIDFGLLGG